MKILFFSVLFFMILAANAQSGINYKALIKDGGGAVLVSQSVTVQFSILEGVAQTNVYQETHSTTTDANGFVILNIGEGTLMSGNYSQIAWGDDEHFLNVQINSGAGLTDMGTTQFMAVPYAKFAEDTKKGTLNDAYNKGGDGAGRTIDAIHGKVEITGNGLEIKNNSTFTQPQLALVEDNASYARLKFKNTNRNGDDFWDIAGFIGDEAANDKLNIYNSDGGDILTATGDGSVGVGTTNPKGALDVVTTNDTGLVIPRVSSVENVTDGNGNPPVNGTIVYDLSRNSICFYLDGNWACGSYSISGGVAFDNPVQPFQETPVYIKASNTEGGDNFGYSIALSADGSTLAVGAKGEDGAATGVNGDQTSNNALYSGAVYTYRRVAGVWTFDAYIKASNTEFGDNFGSSISLNADGTTLAVGAENEGSNAVGSNGDQSNNDAVKSGAVYIYTRSGNTWGQQAYLKASNTENNDSFGFSISLDNSGNTLVVSAPNEDSNAVGNNGNQMDNSENKSGAAYVFSRSGTTWIQKSYLKASNTEAYDNFGFSVSISGDGLYIIISAIGEASASTGVNGNQNDNSNPGMGAAYIFLNNGGVLTQQAYLKPAVITNNTYYFGYNLSIDNTGSRLAISAPYEDSNAVLVNGDATNSDANNSGAVYVFSRSGSTWSQEAYIKASNTEASDLFGYNIALSRDGTTLLASAVNEASNATGINGDQSNNTAEDSGAAYVYKFANGSWKLNAYIKATNTGSGDFFGWCTATNIDGSVITISTPAEDSSALGVGGDQNNNGAEDAGAVYFYEN